MNFLSTQCLPSWIIACSLLFTAFMPPIAAAEKISPHSIEEKLAKLEAASGGRIGIYAINTANGKQVHYRADERFPMGCTSKVMGVAAILKKV
ncbi:serine hydrolase [Legionella tunisiensis]|uniref:serine hydrolase n=1 Tax=Legionella tunisiensis TaxID=1034944 RepID=UPI00031C53CF|nr:serine hydrolase [Legionella tunisiensis]